MTEAMPFLQKTILLSYDPRPLRGVRVVSAIVYNISVEWSTVFVQL